MSYKQFAEAADSTVNLEDGIERYVYLELAYRADRRGIVRMPQSELAQVTLLSPRTIARIFSAFEKRQLISRVGHGRYAFVAPTQNPDAVGLTDKLRQWINNRDEDAMENGQVQIWQHEEGKLPQFVNDAIIQGLLTKAEHDRVLVGKNEWQDFTWYAIHI